MSDTKENFKKIVDGALLESILLKSSHSDVALPPGIIGPEITKVDVNYSFSHAFNSEMLVLFSFVAIDLIGMLNAEGKVSNPDLKIKDDKLFGCSCVFVAKYIVKNQLSEEECDTFTRTTALFNVYPYLREYVSSEFNKMGLPGVFLPLLKTGKSVEDKTI